MSITAETKNEVERLLQRGQKIYAIKYLCDSFGISLAESKLLVEAVEKERSQQSKVDLPDPSLSSLSWQQGNEVADLLRKGKRMEAIRYVQNLIHIGLAESVKVIDEIGDKTNPNYRSVSNSRGRLGSPASVVPYIFGCIGLLLCGIAGSIYYYQNKTIKSSELISGKTIDFRTSGSGTAPVIEYQWLGQKKLYYSTTFSNPPSYEMGEEVSMYVNRNDPEDVIVNTFSDRWLLITILGGMGTFFVLFSALFMFLMRKF